MRAELAHVVTITRQPDETRALAKMPGDAQGDIAAPDQQDALHHATSGAPAGDLRARASRDPSQEPSIPILTQPR